ncbi:uridine kinase [Cystoisospora suis]|uniref:Uridine kinase n=1 Tax=Cystoisospora suis TaxID=483139 RepID=A0A2C6KJ08_9APIC|nr:uridine kinase [Cystoisospora suis]
MENPEGSAPACASPSCGAATTPPSVHFSSGTPRFMASQVSDLASFCLRSLSLSRRETSLLPPSFTGAAPRCAETPCPCNPRTSSGCLEQRSVSLPTAHVFSLHSEPSYGLDPLRRGWLSGGETSLHTASASTPLPHSRRSPMHSSEESGPCLTHMHHPRVVGVVEPLFPVPVRDFSSCSSASTGSAEGQETSTLRGGGYLHSGAPCMHVSEGCVLSHGSLASGKKSTEGLRSASGGTEPGAGVKLHQSTGTKHPKTPDALSLHLPSKAYCTSASGREGGRRFELSREGAETKEIPPTAGRRLSSPRCLIAVAGIPGSGKSTIASALAAEMNRLWRQRRSQIEDVTTGGRVASTSGYDTTQEKDGNLVAGANDASQSPTSRRHEISVGRHEGDERVTGKTAESHRDHSEREEEEELCVVVGMDGFHLTREELSKLPNSEEAFCRRGAPWTFRLPEFWRSLHELKYCPDQTVHFPTFDHAVKDPVPNGVSISPSTRVVIVEGLYLCLKATDEAEEDKRPEVQVDASWFNQEGDLFDLRLYVDAPLEKAAHRVIQRHLASGICLAEQDAARRWTESDIRNADFILRHLEYSKLDAVIVNGT